LNVFVKESTDQGSVFSDIIEIFDTSTDLKGIYSFRSVIPSDFTLPDTVAYVPIIRNPHKNVFLKNLPKILVISGIISIFLYALGYLKIPLGHLSLFDFVRLFLGQSISWEPQKSIPKIIYLTVAVVSVKVMNDFLLDTILLMVVEDSEMPF